MNIRRGLSGYRTSVPSYSILYEGLPNCAHRSERPDFLARLDL